MQFKHLRCKCTTKAGRTCDTFLGNLEIGRKVTVQIPCMHSKGHKDDALLTEFTQSENGVVSFRVVNRGEQVAYADDGVRIQYE